MTQFYKEYCEEHVSTKAEISCDLLKALYRLEHEHDRLCKEVAVQEQRAAASINQHFEGRLRVLNEENRELREKYKEAVQSRNLRKDLRLPLHSR